MGEVRVNGASDHLAVVGGELGDHVGESDQFGWTHKGKIQWVEEEENPLALKTDRK